MQVSLYGIASYCRCIVQSSKIQERTMNMDKTGTIPQLIIAALRAEMYPNTFVIANVNLIWTKCKIDVINDRRSAVLIREVPSIKKIFRMAKLLLNPQCKDSMNQKKIKYFNVMII
jgi:hypothetical protein